MVSSDELKTEDDRQGVLVAIGLATGFLCMVAATTAVSSTGWGALTVLLVLAGAAAFVFAGAVFMGKGDWLTADDQLLWSFADEDDEDDEDDE